jgi:biotin carboxyl carrier protein
MADELNGRDGRGGAATSEPGTQTVPSGGLRVSFPMATQPEGVAAAALVELGGIGRVAVDGEHADAALAALVPPRGRLDLDGQAYRVLALRLPSPQRAAAGVDRFEVVVDGWRFELDVESEARARLRERATSVRGDAARGGPVELRAIIPGRVVSLDVAEGDSVEPGARLLVLEAMKMQNEVRAPRGGTVARVAVGPGQTVELGDVLLVIE